MFKTIRMVKRRKGMALDEFKAYYLDRHAALLRESLETAPIRRVVASFSTGEIAMGGTEAQFDAMTAVYFDSLEDLRGAKAAAAATRLLDDEKHFVDHSPINIVADEYLMSQKPGAGARLRKAGQLKVIRTVYRRNDLTHPQFKDYWRNKHSKLEDIVVKESPTQYIVATFAITEPDGKPDMDGMVELYYESLADIKSMFTSKVPQMMRDDEANFVQMDAPAIRAVTEEHHIAGADR